MSAANSSTERAERDLQASLDFQARVDRLRIDVAKQRAVPLKQLIAFDNQDKLQVDNLKNRISEINGKSDSTAADRAMLERLSARLAAYERMRSIITEVFAMMPAGGKGLEAGDSPSQSGSRT